MKFIVIFELDTQSYTDWPWWKPGYWSYPFNGDRWRRFIWGWFGASWIGNQTLPSCLDYIEKNKSEWKV